jgi:hypothetical protein
MRRLSRLHSISFLALALILTLGASARAADEIFTYTVNASPGTYGTLTGFFSIIGTPGESFALDPDFDGVVNFDLTYSSFGPSFDLNPFDSFNISDTTLDFTGDLGDPVLTPLDGFAFVFSLEGFDGTDYGPAIALDAGPTEWVAGFFPFAPFDGGYCCELDLASLSPVPLAGQTHFQAGGKAVLAAAGAYSSLRRHSHMT